MSVEHTRKPAPTVELVYVTLLVPENTACPNLLEALPAIVANQLEGPTPSGYRYVHPTKQVFVDVSTATEDAITIVVAACYLMTRKILGKARVRRIRDAVQQLTALPVSVSLLLRGTYGMASSFTIGPQD